MNELALASELDLQLAHLGEEMHAFLERVPAYLKKGQSDELKLKCQSLIDRVPNAQMDERLAKLKASLSELSGALDGQPARSYAMAKYEEAARAYEHWRTQFREAWDSAGVRAELSLKALKPQKLPRALFHASMGVLAFISYQFFLDRRGATLVLLVLLAVIGSLEITRRMSRRWNHLLVTGVFKLIARPGEYYKVNSATYYLLALCLLTPVFSREALLAGVLVLAFGDPAAGWFGRRWGTLKIHKNKSLVGSTAFAGAGALVAGAYLLFFAPGVSAPLCILAACLASLAGAVAELFSDRLDDNLTVPVAAVLTTALVLM